MSKSSTQSMWSLYPAPSDQSTHSQLHHYCRWVTGVSSQMLESVTADIQDQKASDHIFDKQGLLNKEFVPERKTLMWILHSGAWVLTEADFKSEVINFKRIAKKCPCSFYHDNKMLQHHKQPAILSTWPHPSRHFYSLEWKLSSNKDVRMQVQCICQM